MTSDPAGGVQPPPALDVSPLTTWATENWHYFLLLILAACAAGALYGFAATAGERRREKRRNRKEGATWATKHEAKPLTTADAEPGRLVTLEAPKEHRSMIRGSLLGLVLSDRMTHPGYISLAADHSALVFGGSTSGKTLRILVPNLNRWLGPSIAISTKLDLISYTASNRPDSVVFCPGQVVPGMTMVGWSPLDGITEALYAGDPDRAWEIALQRGKAMVATQSLEEVKSGSYWKDNAALNLAPLLLAAAADESRSIGDVLAWIQTFDLETPDAILRDCDEIPDQARFQISALGNLSGDMQSGTFGTLQTALSAYNFPAVLAGAKAPHRFRPSWLLDTDGHQRTLYITAPSHLQKALAPIFNGIIEEVMAARYAEADAAAAPLREAGDTRTPAIPVERRLLLMADEAANIAPMPMLPDYVSEGAGHGVTGMYAYQDLSQLIQSQGQHNAMTVVNNCQAIVVTPGMKDQATLNAFEMLLGRHDVDRTSTTRGRDTSHTTSTEHLPLVEAAGIRTLKDGQGIVIYGKHHPIRSTLMPYGHWTRPRQPRRTRDLATAGAGR